MVWVGIGLLAFGASNFAFLGLAGRALGAAGAAPVAVLWTLLNAVGIGLFLPLEQEVGRRLSARRAAGRALDGAARGTVRYAAAALVAIAVVALVARDVLARDLLGGDRVLVLVLAVALAGQALAYALRGFLAGVGQFRHYGAQLAVDAGIRTLGAVILFATGWGSAVAFAWLLVAAPVLAALVTVPAASRPDLGRSLGPSQAVADPSGGAPRGDGVPLPADRGPADLDGSAAPDGTVEVPGRMGPLVAASAAGQVLANAGPLAIAALATAAQQGLTGRFVAAVTIARIPLFLFAAVQAVFLPRLAAMVAGGRTEAFGADVRRALAATAALGALGTAGIAVLGPWALQLVYGPEFTLAVAPMVLVAASGGLFMLAQVVAQALLAHHADTAVAAGWVAGLVGCVVSLAIPLELALRVSVALCVGSVVALAAHAGALRLVTARWHRTTLHRVDRRPTP